MGLLLAMYRLLALVGARQRGDAGATAAEYALLAALVAAVIVLAVTAFGGEVLALFEGTNAAIDAA